MSRSLLMPTTHTQAQDSFLDPLQAGVGVPYFLNCMDPLQRLACGLGRASVFAALGFLERPNAVNRFACPRREVLFAT
jgi:hypothetical protein